MSLSEQGQNVKASVVEKHCQCRLACSRLTKKQRILIWSLIFSSLVCIALLIFLLIFFVFIPQSIKASYHAEIQFENLQFSRWHVFPDATTYVNFTLEGELIHPSDMVKYQGRFYTWRFKNKKGESLFEDQPFTELHRSKDETRSQFISNLSIRGKGFTFTPEIFTNEEPNYNTGAGFSTASSKYQLDKIELVGKFGSFPELTIEIPATKFKTAARKAVASTPVVRESKLSEFQFHDITVFLTQKGFRFEARYSSNGLKTEFKLAKGTYPIFKFNLPVLVLIANEGIDIQRTKNDARLTFELEFVKEYAKTGKELLIELGISVLNGETSLTLGNQMLGAYQEWKSSILKDKSAKVIRFPNFKHHLDQFKIQPNQVQPQLRSLSILGNRIELNLQLQVPLMFNLHSLAIDFGANFEIYSGTECIVKLELSNLSIQTKKEHQFIFMNMALVFPQAVSEIKGFETLFQDIFTPQFPLNLSIRKLAFFSTSTSSSISLSAPYASKQCDWCDSLFFKQINSLPLISDDVRFNFTISSLISSLKFNQHLNSTLAKVSQLSISRKRGSNRFNLGTLIDIPKSNLEILNLPFISVNLIYNTDVLGKLTLPKGLQNAASVSESHTLQLESEFEINRSPSVQALFQELMESMLRSTFTKEQTLVFSKFKLGEGNAMLNTFEPFIFGLNLHELHELSQSLIEFDLLDDLDSKSISLLNLQVTVLNPFTYVANFGLELKQKLPFSFEIEDIGFVMSIPKFGNLQFLISEVKTEKDTNFLQVHQMLLTRNTDEASILATALQFVSAISETQNDLPTQLCLKKITFDQAPPVVALSQNRSNVPALESLSRLEYTLDLPPLKPIFENLHFSDFQVYFNAFKLNSFNLENLSLKDNVISLDVTLDFDFTLSYGFSAKFISFDILLLKRKLGHLRVIGFEIQPNKHQEMALKVSVEVNTNFLKGEEQQIHDTSSTEGLILAHICNLCIGGDEKDSNLCSSSSLPIPLTESAFIHMSNFLANINPKFEFKKPQSDQIEEHTSQNEFDAPSLLSKAALNFLRLLIFKNLASEIRLKVGKIQTQVLGSKVIFNVAFESSAIHIDLNDLMLHFSIFNDIKLAKVNLEVVSFVTTDPLCTTAEIKVEIEFTPIDLPANQDLNVATANPRNLNENELEFEKLIKLILSSPIQIKLLRANGKGALKRLLQRIVSLEQGFVLPLPLNDSNNVNFENLYTFESLFSHINSNFFNLQQQLPLSTVSISFQSPMQKEGINVFSTLVEFQLDPKVENPIQVEFQMPYVSIDIFLNTTQIGVASLSAIHCKSCSTQPLNLKLTLDTSDTPLSQDAMKKFVHSILNEEATPMNFNFGQLKFDQSLSKKTLLNLLLPPVSSKVFRRWIGLPRSASNSMQRNTPSQDDNLIPSSSSSSSLKKTTSEPVMPKITVRSLSFFSDLNLDLKLGISFDSFEWTKETSETHGLKMLVLNTGELVSILEEKKKFRNLHLTNFRIGPSSSFLESDGQKFSNLFSKVQFDIQKLLAWNAKTLLDVIQKIQVSNLAFLPDESNANLEFQAALTYPKSFEEYLPEVELSITISNHETFTLVTKKSQPSNVDFSGKEIRGVFANKVNAHYPSKFNVYDQRTLKSTYLHSIVIHGSDAMKKNIVEIQNSVIMMDPKLIDYLQLYALNQLLRNSVSFPWQCSNHVPSIISSDQLQFSQVFNSDMNARAIVKFPCPSNIQLNVNHLQFDVIRVLKEDNKVALALTIEINELIIESSPTTLLRFQVNVLNRTESVSLDLLETEALSKVDTHLWVLRDFKLGTSKATSKPIQNLKFILDKMTIEPSTLETMNSSFLAWWKAVTHEDMVSPLQLDTFYIKALNWPPTFNIDLQLSPPVPSQEILSLPNFAFHFEFQNVELRINKTSIKPRRLFYDTHTHLKLQTMLGLPHPSVFQELSSFIPVHNLNDVNLIQLPHIFLNLDDLAFHEKVRVPIQQKVNIRMKPDAMEWINTTNLRSSFTQVNTEFMNVTMPELGFRIKFGFQFPTTSVLQLNLSDYSISTSVSVEQEKLGTVELRSMVVSSTSVQGVMYFTPRTNANWESLSMSLTPQNEKNIESLLPKFEFSKLTFHSLDTSLSREQASIALVPTTYYLLNMSLLGPIPSPEWEITDTQRIAVEKPVGLFLYIKRVRFKIIVEKFRIFGATSYSQAEIHELQLVPNQSAICIEGELKKVLNGFSIPSSCTIHDVCLNNDLNEEMCFKDLKFSLNLGLMNDKFHFFPKTNFYKECVAKNEAKTGKVVKLIINQ